MKKLVRFLVLFGCLVFVKPILTFTQDRSVPEKMGAKISLLEEKLDALSATQKTLVAKQTEIENELTSLGIFIRKRRA